MSAHHCPTGWHVVPQAGCREKHGCDCPPCVDDYRRRWRRKMHRLYGYNDQALGPADATRAQLRMLLEAGWSRAAIARAVGCDRATIRWTARGDERRVSRRVREGVECLWREQFARQEAA